MDIKYILKLGLTLFITCVVVAGLLGLVNAITEDKIAVFCLENTQKAMKAVVEDPSATFTEAMELTDAMKAATAAAGGTLDSVYGVQVGGKNAGYAVKVVASGSQGNIEMMVGVNADGAVTGVSIVKAQETSGIGSKVIDNEPVADGTPVLDQFKGLSAADAPTVGKNVDAISGATVTSKGVTTGVNAALAAVGAIG